MNNLIALHNTNYSTHAQNTWHKKIILLIYTSSILEVHIYIYIYIHIYIQLHFDFV